MANINGNEIYFGIIGEVGSGSGYILGEAEAATTASALEITNLGDYYLRAAQLITDLQAEWDWDDSSTLTWGCFSLTASGNSSIILKDTYTDNANTYGGTYSTGTSSSKAVTIAKSSSAIMIDMNGGSIAFFTAMDENGDSHKCIAAAMAGNTYRVYIAADDGTSANVFGVSNNNGKRTTTNIYELTPFFDETADGIVRSDNILVVRSCPAITTGLYSIGDNKFFFGNYLALKDSV
jgi:hypothetical protein